jgi:rhodanese-related sulfurtransferase
MALDFMTICAAVVVAAVLVKRVGDRRELERHAITPEALHALLAWNRNALVVDVRQPLDLLGNSVIIPGAKWFVPRAVLDDPSLIPRRKNLVVYCTCPAIRTAAQFWIELSRWGTRGLVFSRTTWTVGEQKATLWNRSRSPSVLTRIETAI